MRIGLWKVLAPILFYICGRFCPYIKSLEISKLWETFGMHFCNIAHIMALDCFGASVVWLCSRQERGTGMNPLPALFLWNTLGMTKSSTSCMLKSYPENAQKNRLRGESSAGKLNCCGTSKLVVLHCLRKNKWVCMNSWGPAPGFTVCVLQS